MDLQAMEDAQLIEALDDERLPRKRERNDILFRALIKELIIRGVYPKETVDHNPNNVVGMVEGWGARWHEWKAPLECPHCKVDLRDLKVGPPFKREIGHTDQRLDCTTHFTCPDCERRI